MANEFKVRKGLIVQGSGSNIFDVQGSQGQLFSVTDSLVGSLFSVNDISGIPIMEVFSDNTIKMGTFNNEAIIVSGSRTGMGIATPQAELHISGANNDSLFRIQSPASASIMFVSGSGLVGIGTLTPTQKISIDNGNVGFTSGFGISWDSDTEWIRRAAASDQLQLATGNTVRLNIGNTQGQLVTIGLGATTGTAQFQVRGGGATAATTAMRIEDSGGNARLTILDNGTSAFNTSHLYVSGSGNIGIGLTSPLAKLHISGANSLRMQNTGFDTFEWFFSAGTGIAFRNVTDGTTPFFVGGTDDIGIGTTNTSARLHISGASNSNLLRVGSPTDSNILFITGSGNVGIGTATPGVTLDVVGQIRASTTMFNSTTQTNTIQLSSATNLQFRSASIETARYDNNGWGFFNTTPAAKVHISGANADNLFRISSPSATNTLFVSGSGNVGIGTNLPSADLHISGASADSLLRVGSPSNDNILFITGSGRVGIGTSTPSQLFEVVRSGNSKIVAGTNVGVQIATATDWIHLSSSPASSNYINIDAAQTSLPPTEQNNGAPDTAIGASANWNKYLTEPDYWMEIKLNGTIALIPCYNKG
jgi:hypothetical protein